MQRRRSAAVKVSSPLGLLQLRIGLGPLWLAQQALQKVEQEGEMMIASKLPCFTCSKSLSRSLLKKIYPRLPLDIDAEHLEVKTFRSAELLQAALHVPASRSPRKKVQNSHGPLSCHRCRRWRISWARLGRSRSGIATLCVGCLAGRCSARRGCCSKHIEHT